MYKLIDPWFYGAQIWIIPVSLISFYYARTSLWCNFGQLICLHRWLFLLEFTFCVVALRVELLKKKIWVEIIKLLKSTETNLAFWSLYVFSLYILGNEGTNGIHLSLTLGIVNVSGCWGITCQLLWSCVCVVKLSLQPFQLSYAWMLANPSRRGNWHVMVILARRRGTKFSLHTRLDDLPCIC